MTAIPSSLVLESSQAPAANHTPARVGIYGLGGIGYHFARNLANTLETHPAGTLPLYVFNRTVEKSERLLKELGPEKIKIADSPEQLAIECNIVFTSLANDDVVKSVYQKFHAALKDSVTNQTRIFVETSTIYPALAGELDKLVSEIPHARLVTCPVFGTPPAADKRALIFIMSGDHRSKREIAHLLVPGVGRKVMDLGGNVEKAPTFKLIGNSIIIGAIEAISESFTLADKSGVGAEVALELMKELMPAPGLIAHATGIINNQLDGSIFSIDGIIKDASHIRRLTGDWNSPMPVIDVAHQRLLTARALHVAQLLTGKSKYKVLGGGAIIAGSRVAAGLDGFERVKRSSIEEEVD